MDGTLNEIRAKNTLVRREQELSYTAHTKVDFYPERTENRQVLPVITVLRLMQDCHCVMRMEENCSL